MGRLLVALAAPLLVGCSDPPYLVLASTTSTQNSGLLDAILPVFTEATGVDVRVVAVGTGQALLISANCDADAVLVHDRASEDRFVAEGHSSARFDVMYNDFVVVGPRSDPAKISGVDDVVTALKRIASTKATFVSRGDDSGTHKAELRIWHRAGVDVEASSGSWYRETGSGQGATLNAAAGMRGYTLSDRGTWISFKNKQDLAIHSEGDPLLFNPYGVMAVDAERCRSERTPHALAFVTWLTSERGQAAISNYRLDGEALFFPAVRSRTPTT